MTSTSLANQSGTNKTWELSLYELNREPHQVITDETEIKVSPRTLHSELMCPICLDLLKKTMTTKECLHRFCSECIITALRSGNKECPTCRYVNYFRFLYSFAVASTRYSVDRFITFLGKNWLPNARFDRIRTSIF
jgi:hypothetical protein